MYNQNQPLPFNPLQQQAPLLNLSLNNPPYVPRYNGDPQLQQMTPTVAAITAMEIQNNLNKNPLRMFMFNMYSQNSFANREFEILVTTIMDYMSLGLMNRSYYNIDMAMQLAIPEMVEMFCAANIRAFPSLEGYLDPSIINISYNAINNLDRIMVTLNSMKQQQQYGYQQNQYQNNNRYMMQGNSGYQQTPISSAIAPSSSSGIFSSNQQQMRNDPGTGRAITGSRYNNVTTNPTVELQQPFTPRNNKMNEEVNNTTTDSVVIVPANNSKYKWKPTNTQHYLLAYDPTEYTLKYKVNTETGTVMAAFLENKIGSDMEYDRHVINTVFGHIPKELSFDNESLVLTNIKYGIDGINNATEKLHNITDDTDVHSPEITTFIDNKVICDTSLKSAWFTLAINRLRADTVDNIPYVYRVYADIAEPIISTVDYYDIVKDYGSSRTYIELREKLDSSINEVNIELWSLVNKKMTDLINRILKQNLALPNYRIDSFVADIQDMSELIITKYGDNIFDAFVKNQKEYIASTIHVLDKDIAKDMTSYFLDEYTFAEDLEPKITYVASGYSLTYLNCISHELNIELSDNVGVVVERKYTPLMHDLLDGLFKDIDERGSSFDRNLIRTADGRILEGTRGAIGDVYILTLIE